MSNLRDAMGLCLPYGKANSQYQTEFEPATGTIWGYFNPPGTPCFSLSLLKDIGAHDEPLAMKQGRVEIDGQVLPHSSVADAVTIAAALRADVAQGRPA
jgi:hypothetical protein